MSNPIVDSVEATLKADVAKEEAAAKGFLAKTVTVKVAALIAVGAFVLGLVAHAL